MLKIQSEAALVGALKLAEATKSTESLVHWLIYLDTLFGRDSAEVRLRPDLPADEKLLCWYAHRIEKDEVNPHCFYSGGIVFDAQANTWSIHS